MEQKVNRAAQSAMESSGDVSKGLDLLKRSPAAAKAMSRTIQAEGKQKGIAQKEIDQIKRDINNPVKLDKLAVEAERGEPESISGAWTMALATFLPTIVAGLAGGAEAGMTALKGTQAGIGIMSDIQDMELKGMQMPKAGSFQQVRNVATKSGKPVTFDSARNVYVYANTDEAVPQHDLVSKVGETLDLSKQRLDLQQAQLDFQKIKQDALQRHRDEPAAKVASEIGQLNYVLDILDRTETLKKDVDTGFFTNIIETAKGAVGQQDVGFQKLKSNVIDSLAQYIRSISGATVTEQERAWLAQTTPSMNMGEEQFVEALNEYRRRIRVLIHNKVKAESDAGRDMTNFDANAQEYLDPKFIGKDYKRKNRGKIPSREEILKKIQYLENKRGAK